MKQPGSIGHWIRVLSLGLALVFSDLTAHAAEVGHCIRAFSSHAKQAEIQQALDTLPLHGEVLLSPGRYEITEPLLLRRNDETLRGSGPSTILHLSDGADCPVIILGPPLTSKNLSVHHITLANLFIDGNRSHQRAEFWRSAGDGSEINVNGIQVWRVTDASIAHVVCCRCRSGGLVTAGVRHLSVYDFNSFDNQFDGLACYQTEESQFDGLQLHDNLAAGISLDLSFNNNSISNAILAENDLGVFMRDSCHNSFRGLTISKCRHHGVFMAQASEPTKSGWRLCPGTECVGNDFQNLKVDDCGGRAFQVNDISCMQNVISGGQFLRNFLGGLGQPAKNLVQVREIAER